METLGRKRKERKEMSFICQVIDFIFTRAPCYSFSLSDKETEVQVRLSYMSCPCSHSQEVAEQGFKFKVFRFQNLFLFYAISAIQETSEFEDLASFFS